MEPYLNCVKLDKLKNCHFNQQSVLLKLSPIYEFLGFCIVDKSFDAICSKRFNSNLHET